MFCASLNDYRQKKHGTEMNAISSVNICNMSHFMCREFLCRIQNYCFFFI
jgi:hypothetical protein